MKVASCMATLSVQVLHAPSGVVSPVSAVELTVKVVAQAGFVTAKRVDDIATNRKTALLLSICSSSSLMY